MKTPTWQLSTFPRWLHHWRFTPTEWGPPLGKLLGSKANMPTGSPNRAGRSRQGCASDEVKVVIPSIARFGRLAYPGRGEVTNHERLGRRNHGCHTTAVVSVGATGVVSKLAGLNMSE